MSQSNPYAPPTAVLADVAAPSTHDTIRLNRVASGQRLVLFALLGSVVGVASQAVIGSAATVIALMASVLGIVGVVRLSGGLGSSGAVRFLYAFLMLVPLFNLLVMALLSSRATKALRAAGYTVGLLGANQR